MRDIATLCGIWAMTVGEGVRRLDEPGEHYCEYFVHTAQITGQIGHE